MRHTSQESITSVARCTCVVDYGSGVDCGTSSAFLLFKASSPGITPYVVPKGSIPLSFGGVTIVMLQLELEKRLL